MLHSLSPSSKKVLISRLKSKKNQETSKYLQLKTNRNNRLKQRVLKLLLKSLTVTRTKMNNKAKRILLMTMMMKILKFQKKDWKEMINSQLSKSLNIKFRKWFQKLKNIRMILSRLIKHYSYREKRSPLISRLKFVQIFFITDHLIPVRILKNKQWSKNGLTSPRNN